MAEPIQFLLRCGYVDAYPKPVSERRPVAWFIRDDRAGAGVVAGLTTAF